MKKIAIIGLGVGRSLPLNLNEVPVEEIRIAPETVFEDRHTNDIRDPRKNFYKTVNKPVQRIRRGRR